MFRNSTNRVNFGVKVSELVNVSELSGGEQKVSGPKIRKYGQGHFLEGVDGTITTPLRSTIYYLRCRSTINYIS